MKLMVLALVLGPLSAYLAMTFHEDNLMCFMCQMCRFLMICLMVLPFYGCESIQLTRYLEARYCPRALVLKGAEKLTLWREDRFVMEAKLASFGVSCDVDSDGDNIDDPKFTITDIDLEMVFRGQIRGGGEGSFRLPLFIALLRKSDNRVIWRQSAQAEARGDSFRHKMTLTFPQAQELNRAEYVLLGGFIVDEAQIDNNLKPYISRQKKKSKPL